MAVYKNTFYGFTDFIYKKKQTGFDYGAQKTKQSHPWSFYIPTRHLSLL